MKTIKQTSWGFEIHIKGQQVGAIVGPDKFMPYSLNSHQLRCLRKWGVCQIA